MSFDTEVLIIGAGMSGLGLAVQIIRKFGIKNFELIEKSEDVGGTWLANTYPGCGCDVSRSRKTSTTFPARCND
jgi:cation diffusion facilitator CzcD-associated flavoprotein CzcO